MKMPSYLDVPALGDLSEVLLALESLVFPVVRHAEDTKLRLVGVLALGKHDEFGHERHVHSLLVELGGEPSHFVHLPAVHEPKSERTEKN